MTEKINITLISSVDINYGIGNAGDLLFDIPYDKKKFREITTSTKNPTLKNAVIMGYNTWNSIPKKYAPLSKRKNIILTRTRSHMEKLISEDVEFCKSIDKVLELCNNIKHEIETFYVIGGSQLYKLFLPHANKIVLCNIHKKASLVDTYFPKFDKNKFRLLNKTPLIVTTGKNMELKTNQNMAITYSIFADLNNLENLEENQYLDLLGNILMNGDIRKTRSGTTRSIFGAQMKFSLENNQLPLLTTKKMFTRGILEELFWFINSKVDSKILESKKVKIWVGNSSREFLDSLGLTSYREGECGPIYGYQWRHFNAEYKGADADYTGEGIDQLAECINLIKNSPNSRRIIMSGWNPCQLKEMCLPPCHVLYQFYVNDGKLYCSMYQRSGDMFLGIPFNIASTSFLTIMMAAITGLKPGGITHTIGDAHIYDDHIEQVCTQLSRKPYLFPKVYVNQDVSKIEDFKVSDFNIENYTCHPRISAKMNV